MPKLERIHSNIRTFAAKAMEIYEALRREDFEPYEINEITGMIDRQNDLSAFREDEEG